MKHILKQFLQRDAHPVIQFIKYGIGGGIATAVDLVVFYTLAWKVFPALTADDVVVKTLGLTITVIDEAIRPNRYIIDRCITFLFSNLTAYVVNILWVFQPGRHPRWLEILLFYVVSIVSFVAGGAVGWALIRYYGCTTTTAYLANMVSAVLINYVARKYLVFKG